MSFLKDVSAPLGDAAGPPCTACQQSCDANRGVQWSGQPYHRNCLACTRCRAILSNNIAEHKSRPVCIDCHAYYSGKTCARCGEGAPSAIQAMDKRFHADCFTCAFCNEKLGNAYVEDNDRPYHEDCIRKRDDRGPGDAQDTRSAWELMQNDNSCSTCRKTVPVGEGLSVRSPSSSGGRAFFHEECFTCNKCRTKLSGQFVTTDSGFFCQRCGDSVDNKVDADPCEKCRKPLVGNLTKALGKTYHADCFGCSKCGCKFPDKQFVNVDGRPMCEKCA